MSINTFGGLPSGLVEVRDIPYSAEYHREGRPGARTQLYLHDAAAARLRFAQEQLKAFSTPSKAYGVLVWDGFRSSQVQQGIFEEYKALLMSERGLDSDAAHKTAFTFVSDPSSVFPHGTGGTVDLTLTLNGKAAEMGTGFDDFTEQAHRDWYLKNPPSDDHSWEAHRNRVILYEAMEKAGFVGLEDEWWHFEWGTERWARTLDRKVLLKATLEYPPFEEMAA